MKTVSLTDFLTTEQIKQARKLKSAAKIAAQVIEPNIKEINKKLGQENDSLYLGYACEHVFNEIERFERENTN